MPGSPVRSTTDSRPEIVSARPRGRTPLRKTLVFDDTAVLEESDWRRPHVNSGTYVWAPAPAAAGSALEWLGESIHKRLTSVHVVVIPRLFTSSWRKQLGKTADIWLTIPLFCLVWQTDNLEPLVLAISLPLVRLPSWHFRNSPLVQGVESRVSEMWDSYFSHVGCCLWKLLSTARSLS